MRLAVGRSRFAGRSFEHRKTTARCGQTVARPLCSVTHLLPAESLVLPAAFCGPPPPPLSHPICLSHSLFFLLRSFFSLVRSANHDPSVCLLGVESHVCWAVLCLASHETWAGRLHRGRIPEDAEGPQGALGEVHGVHWGGGRQADGLLPARCVSRCLWTRSRRERKRDRASAREAERFWSGP